MFEFLMSADLGINPIDIGTVTPTFSSAFSTPLPPMTEPLSEETIARFQAAMEKPLADNAILQQALESMVVTKEKPVVVIDKPEAFPVATPATFKAVSVEKPVVPDRPQDKVLATENTKVTEAAIVEKPVSVKTPKVVVAETPKASAPSVNFVDKEQPVVVSVDKPVVSDRPQDKVLAAENTKVTENTTTVVSEKPQVVVPETPKASAPSVNFVDKEIAPEKPVIVVSEKSVVQVEAPVLATENTKITEAAIVEKPVSVETPKAFENSVNFLAKELPVATPETFKAVIVENKEVAKVLEAVVSEKPTVVVSEKQVVQVEAPVLATENTKVTEKPVVSDRSQDTGIVKPETTIVEKPVVADKKAVAIEKTVVADKPTVVVPETPKASESSVNFVAKERPIATPETFKAVVVENKEVAKVFDAVVSEKPMSIVSDKPLAQGEAPILATKNTKGAENTTIVVSDKPAVVETPKSSVNYVAKEIAIEKPVVADKSAVVVEKPVMTEEKRPEEVVITAMPNAIPEATVQPIAVPEVKVAPIVSASVEAKVEAVTAAEVLVQAATAVADTMLVSPGLMRGEGEIIVHLKPEVLEATELKISVQSGTMTVEFAPTVEKIATLLTQNQANLVQVLSERVGRYNVVVNVRPSHLKGTRNARA